MEKDGLEKTGHIQLDFLEDGVYITVFHPKVGNGITLSDAIERVAKKQINNYDLNSIEKAVKTRNSQKFKIAEAQEELKIDATIKVYVSKDRLKSYIIATPPDGGKEISQELILAKLREMGVVYGIKEDVIKTFLELPKYNEQILVAEGKVPQDGKNGSVKYLFATNVEKKPHVMEDGRVDYYNLGLIQNVIQGQELVEITFPTEGVDGIDIFNRELKAKPGKKVIPPKGKNVSLTQDETIIVADLAGKAFIQDGKVTVTPVVEIPGDVGASTGNICFVGSVVVKGNVLNGFKVEAGGTIEVSGVVEGAEIKATGDIILSKGVQGMNRAIISSGENIIAKYIENAKVEAKGNINCDAIMHSKIKCSGNLELEGKKGLIVGGDAKVRGDVVAKTIGSPMATVTEIEVGILPEELDEVSGLKKELNQVVSDIQKTDQAIKLLGRLKESGCITKEKEEMLVKMVRTKVLLNTKLNELKPKLEELEQKAGEDITSKIKATKVHPGVTITIGNSKKFIKETTQYCVFYEENKSITMGLL